MSKVGLIIKREYFSRVRKKSFIVVTVLVPLLIAFLFLKVSGIPMLEAKYEGDPDFEDYRRTTHAFFPWWPKTGQ